MATTNAEQTEMRSLCGHGQMTSLSPQEGASWSSYIQVGLEGSD